MELFSTENLDPRRLTEKYRPRNFSDLCGQPDVSAALESFAAKPYPTAFLFTGRTGVGKSSAALALAIALGCAIQHEELGGLHEISSGEQSADNIRETMRKMWQIPFYGRGWRVLVVNECDRMAAQAETVWLDVLEKLPAHCVVVFSTNNPDKLTDRFKDRCERLNFRSTWDDCKQSAMDLAKRIWQTETGRTDYPDISLSSVVDEGHVSYRRVVQAVSNAVRAGKGMDPTATKPIKADKPTTAPTVGTAAWFEMQRAARAQ